MKNFDITCPRKDDKKEKATYNRRKVGCFHFLQLTKYFDITCPRTISTGDEVGKLAYGTGQIPFIRTSDIANWEIKLDPKQGLSDDIYTKLAPKQDVQPYDILMVRDGTYLVGTCAMISPSETKIVYQSHLYKIRSNDHDRINPYLLLALLVL